MAATSLIATAPAIIFLLCCKTQVIISPQGRRLNIGKGDG